MGRSRAVLAVCVAALVCAGGSAAARADSPTVQELTITGSGGVHLACGLVLPAGSPPSGGWPGLILFPAFGWTHAIMEQLAVADFAPAGFASLSCDQRGTGSSGGSFDLAGPADVADAQAQFDWLAARSDVSDTEIGAYGESLGGTDVWNAAVADVPFKAIVPVRAWTSLASALGEPGAVNTSVLHEIEHAGPPADWDSPSGLAARSSRGRLHALTTPALIVQSRQDLGLQVDLDQATTAYKLLAGPKRLYVGDISNVGHPKHSMPEVVAWFEQYLAGGAAVGGGVELEHAPWDGATTKFAGLPLTRHVSVNLPGTKRLTPSASAAATRSVRPTGGPLETFGNSTLTVRYSGASNWSELVAVVTSPRTRPFVIEGATKITAPAGVVKIPLQNELGFLPRGRRLVISVQSASPALPSVFQGNTPPPGAHITVKRMTLELSVLRLAVSR